MDFDFLAKITGIVLTEHFDYIYAMLVTEQKLIISGNLIQALGGLVSLADELNDPTASGQIYNIIGNLLQSIGNSLQAIAGMYELENKHVDHKGYKIDENIETLEISGSWIQATGSVMTLIGQIKEEDNEIDVSEKETLH
ncbi:hypothetical protein GCM10011409_19560 [Lentibacillus populi]|uniref:Uncharacterized protein n=1 Tax=Lentibacillus populi TaxID=1827502 RepID=A0A9W5TXB2_9BACI|nr:hypothetical protein GCM10011409_19560 [Lentibacillus populi]